MTAEGPLAHQRELLRWVVGGGRFVVAVDTLVGAAALATVLRDHGADDVLVVAGNRGTGDVDPGIEADAVVLDVAGQGLMGGIRAFVDAVRRPSARLVDAVERFDPDHRARVVPAVFLGDKTLLGRTRRWSSVRTPPAACCA